jgi:type VI secretion system secreted protein Hcp
MAIYMEWAGGLITGDVTDANHEKWIELTAFQWGVGRGIGSATSGQASRESSIPSISEITVTKRMDSASPGLWTDSVAGQLNSDVNIVFTTTDKGDNKEYLKYQLTNTGLSAYQLSSHGDRPQETLSLNFTKVSWTFTSTAPDVSGTPTTQGYDLTTNKTT